MSDQEFIEMNIKNNKEPFDKTIIIGLLIMATVLVIFAVVGTMPQ